MRRRGILFSLLICGSVHAAEIRFTGEEIAGLIQHAFSGARIRFHQEPNAPGQFSYIDLGPNFKGQRFTFAVPPKDIPLGVAGSARFVLNDIQSAPAAQNPIRVTAGPDAFVLHVHFEENGVELKGTPLGRLRSLRARTIPDVEISDIRLEIRLLPDRSVQEIRFQPSVVAFLGTTQAGGLGNLPFFGRRVDLLNPLTDYKRVLKTAIEREVKKLVDRNLPRLAEQLNVEIRKRGQSFGMRVDTMRFDGTDFVIAGALTLR